MNFAVNAASWGLNNILPLFNQATLVFYGQVQPSTPETALAATNTALCTFTFTTTAFAAPGFTSGNDSSVATFATNSVTPAASGTVTFARCALKSAAWSANATYGTLFTVVTNSNNYYVLTKSGIAAASAGPSGATFGSPVADNTCQWTYYSATSGQNNILADFTVGTSGNDIIIGSTSITTTVNVTLTSFILQTTAS